MAASEATVECLAPADAETPVDPKPVEEPGWHALISPNDGTHPFVMDFKSSEILAGYLLEIDGQELYAFPFYGVMSKISEGPLRFFTTHEHNVYPLFSPPGTDMQVDQEELVTQDDYYLGTPDTIIVLPAVADTLDEEEMLTLGEQ